MIKQNFLRRDLLEEKDIDRIHDTSVEIFEETGVEINNEAAREVFEENGARVEDGKVFLDRELIEEYLEQVPSSFTLHARNPENNVEIHANELVKVKDRINSIISKHTGQPKEKVQEDTERDYFMDPEEAKDYGLIDKVIERAEGTEE